MLKATAHALHGAATCCHRPRCLSLGHEPPDQHGEFVNERVTPDGRYFVVRGRLWRRANPSLPAERRETLIRELMTARRAVQAALKSGSADELALARKAVDAAKTALGERGPVWWDDGAPDLNRHKVKDSPYVEWYLAQGS